MGTSMAHCPRWERDRGAGSGAVEEARDAQRGGVADLLILEELGAVAHEALEAMALFVEAAAGGAAAALPGRFAGVEQPPVSA